MQNKVQVQGGNELCEQSSASTGGFTFLPLSRDSRKDERCTAWIDPLIHDLTKSQVQLFIFSNMNIYVEKRKLHEHMFIFLR